ncbi:hypothetical protein PG985_014530 [Apiospora marii]|uniref:uncharacterized protein n=1 Tax=Apiospora marii TaxID=335849 RepID=UPI003131F7D4
MGMTGRRREDVLVLWEVGGSTFYPIASFSDDRTVTASLPVAVATKTRARLDPSFMTLSSDIVGFTKPMFSDSCAMLEVV